MSAHVASAATTRLELHSGLVLGPNPTFDPLQAALDAGPDSRSVGADPRAALETVIGRELALGPCVVRFSGGRDSALVLAVALHVARRDGHELPAALSVRYQGSPDTDESDWQDLIVAHLGARHEVLEVPRGGSDLAGAFGVAQLLRHGPLVPPTAAVSLGLIGPAVAGRTVLTGEGGDEVLGESRISPYVAHWRRRRRPTRQLTRRMLADLLPRPARRAVVEHELRSGHPAPWLRQGPRQEVARLFVDTVVDRPWDWRKARWRTAGSRLWWVGSANLSLVAATHGFRQVHPLLDAGFVAELCRRGGPLGLATRTEAMRLLAGDLLPLKVLRRSTKAVFGEVYAGAPTRAFARDWDGSGVDPDLVDVERLRSAWLAEQIPAPSLTPLQLALVAATGRGWTPAESSGAGS